MPNLPSGWTPYAVIGTATGDILATLLDPAGLAVLPAAEDTEVRLEPLDGRPMLLAAAPDGAIWYTRADDKIGRRDADGTHTTIEVAAGSSPYGIAVATSGDVWFTAAGTNQIVRVTTDHEIAALDLPLPDSRPAMLAVDVDGTPWAALNGAAAIARVNPDDSIDIVGLPAGSAPVGITAAPDGIWFADIARGLVGRISRDGTIDEFPFPDPACRPHAVAPDPAGGCWATLWGSTELARVASDGRITINKLTGQEPHGLWVGPTGVWVAMESGTLTPIDSR